VGWGKILGGGFTYTRFDFDSGVGIPVTLTFWPWGGGVNNLANPPPQRPCVLMILLKINNSSQHCITVVFAHFQLPIIYKGTLVVFRNSFSEYQHRWKVIIFRFKLEIISIFT